MHICRLFLAAAAAIALSAQAPAGPQRQDLAAERLRGHVEFLASDLLEGRETGTRGYDIAAAYVAAEFRKLGLVPGGRDGSWFVQVPLRRASQDGTPKVTLVNAGRSQNLAVGEDLALRPSLTLKERMIDAPLVFAGHGISDRAAGIDEYAGLDVRGAIVVVLEGSPASLASDVAAHLESSKAATAAAKGAVGLIEIADSEQRAGRGGSVARMARPLIDWVGQDGRVGSRGVIALDASISPTLGEKLFDGAKRRLANVRAGARKTAISGFPLGARLQVDSKSIWEDFTSPEVVAIARGGDPTLAGEYVVLTGHLDHLGLKTDAVEGEDRVHNGALDNAAGIATMLETARSFAQSDAAPRRSVMFVAHTGEEKGLIGASYLAANPPVPADRMVALVNLDMPLLLYPFTDVIAFGAEHSTIRSIAAAAARSMGVALSPDPMREQGLFTRSDHYPFVKRGIPSIFLMTGHANGGKAAWDGFLSGAYHSPDDDLAQPIDWQAGARFAELNFRIARALADAPQRPLWLGDSYFGQAFAPGQAKAHLTAGQ